MDSLLHKSVQRLAGQVSAGLSLLGDRAGSRLGILVYHRVTFRVPHVDEPSINVTPGRFRRQLTGLAQCGYEFWSLGQVLEYATRGESIPAKVVAVTFDDGYESVYTNAWPVLRELDIPATIFVNTAFLDSDAPFPFDRWGVKNRRLIPEAAYRPLRTSQYREMLASGLIGLGAHTHTHADFRNRNAGFEADLNTSVEILRRQFGIEHVPFAFPFGRYRLGYVTDELLAAARRVDVTCALTTECELVDPSTDPFGWGRFNVYDWDTPRTIAARLRGWYGWAPRWQDRLAGWKHHEQGAAR